ncbi:SF0329 family protein [Anaerotignum sp.]|uniref:SF0329 family protein n=1 Tax=Anaerotignum sp. TaxID=2039241 RepID=UPI00289EC5C1|nr:hypothetical protein [Anaerotignum sp.]
MEHYKSWAELKKQLNGFLCEALKNRITYFLTRYHEVHNSYGRASILFDGKELVCFSWIEMYYQEYAVSAVHKIDPKLSYEDTLEQLKPEWDKNCTYYEMDFLNAALKFRSMSIKTALESDNYIIKTLAILDKRVGNRTLAKLSNNKEYETYPEWVQQFYKIRFTSSKITF